MERGWSQPVSVGIVTAVVGFTSSFAVVLAGLTAAGADTAQAASGLVALTVLQGAGTIWLSRRFRRPLTVAWSTPGAALLAATGPVAGGWPAVVGAFLVTGALVVLTGLWGRLGRLVAAVSAPLAQAMLAGVLLPLCLEPVRALATRPLLVLPIVVVWVVLIRFAPRWASPAAFLLALVIVVVAAGGIRPQPPVLALTVPSWSPAALVGIALPLYVVTMASQNVPGVAVLSAAGFTVPWRYAMVLTGAGTVLGAPAGGHAVNLAAITAALPASPEAHPDPGRRWVAAQAGGVAMLVLAVGATTLTGLVAAAPEGVIESVAGLALLGTFAAALSAAFATPGPAADGPSARVPAAVALLCAASGTVIGGIGSAFWGLLAGLVLHLALRRRTLVG